MPAPVIFCPPDKLFNSCPEYLARVACLDAYAAAVENLRGDDVRYYAQAMKIDPAYGYLRHPYHGIPRVDPRTSRVRRALLRGMYTDDTERLIANARVLLDFEVEDITRLAFATAYVDEFRYGGERPGYAGGYQVILETVRTGEDLLRKLKPTSCKNGACMGAAVIGMLPSVEDVLRVAAIQASVTHNTRCGVFTARSAALAAHFAFYHDRAELGCLRDYLSDHLETLTMPHGNEIECGHDARFELTLREPWIADEPVLHTDNRPIGLSTVQAALTLVTQETSLIGALRRGIGFQGDTDSVLATAAGIMAPWHRAEQLPAFFERDLEPGSPDTGLPRLLRLGGSLVRRFA